MTYDCEWRPNGLVSWTTDFGLQNAFVGSMRGVFLSRFPGGRLTSGVGDRFQDWDKGQTSRPVLQPEDHFELTVLMVDRFGNVVTNWDVSHSGPLPERAEVRIGSQSVPIVKTYAEVPCMGVLALIDSLGHLEIAQRNGSAAEHFALGVGDALQLRIKP